MRHLFITIVLIIMAFYMGVYVGKENISKFYDGSKKAFSISKDAAVWVKQEWNNRE